MLRLCAGILVAGVLLAACSGTGEEAEESLIMAPTGVAEVEDLPFPPSEEASVSDDTSGTALLGDQAGTTGAKTDSSDDGESRGRGESAGEEDDHDHSDDGAYSFGLAENDSGFLLAPSAREFQPGLQKFSFTVFGRDGSPQVDFEVAHEWKMHLLLVSHDMRSYIHLHPDMDERGMWQTDVDFGHEGRWRVVADFVPLGEAAVQLGADILVGTEDGGPIPTPDSEVRYSTSGPYVATLSGETDHGAPSTLEVKFSRDGVAVAPEEVTPWMGADAHMVAFMTHPDEGFIGNRPARNAFIHAHPKSAISSGALPFYMRATPHGWWTVFVEAILDDEKRTFVFVMNAP